MQTFSEKVTLVYTSILKTLSAIWYKRVFLFKTSLIYYKLDSIIFERTIGDRPSSIIFLQKEGVLIGSYRVLLLVSIFPNLQPLICTNIEQGVWMFAYGPTVSVIDLSALYAFHEARNPAKKKAPQRTASEERKGFKNVYLSFLSDAGSSSDENKSGCNYSAIHGGVL